MWYRLYSLQFITPVRFGADVRGAGLDQANVAGHADVLFSALCTEAAAYSQRALEKLVQAAQAGNLLLSDLLPCHKRSDQEMTLYLPRPLLPPAWETQNRAQPAEDICQDLAQWKQMNKRQYLPVHQVASYLKWLREGGDYSNAPVNCGAFVTADKVNRREPQAMPYRVTAYRFGADWGLYFIVGVTDANMLSMLDNLIDSLGCAGIGGERSSGYGKFQLFDDPIDMDQQGVYEDDAALYAMLTADDAAWYMAISVVWPTKEDLLLLDSAYYAIIQRSGFVNSPAYAPQAAKRHSVHMLNTGTCLRAKAAGQVGDLAAGGGHPVYRYGRGLYVGLKI